MNVRNKLSFCTCEDFPT